MRPTGAAFAAAASCAAQQRLQLDQTIIAAIVNDAGPRLDLFRRIKKIEMDALARDGSPPPIASLIARICDGQGSVAAPVDPDRGAHTPLPDPMVRTLVSLAFHAPGLCEDIVRTFGEDPDRALALLHNLEASVPVYLLFSDRDDSGSESFFRDSCRILYELGFRCIRASFRDDRARHQQDCTAFTPFEEIELAAGGGPEPIEAAIAEFNPDLIHSYGALNNIVGPLAWRNRIPALLGYHSRDGLLRLDETSSSVRVVDDLSRVTVEQPNLQELPPYITSYAVSEQENGERSIIKTFIKDALAYTKLSPKRNVGIYAPWSEQGLGELARIYGRVLRRAGLGVHILSFQAYEAKGRGVAIQHSADDWVAGKDADTVHYSLNDREHVTLHEISQFIASKNVGRFVYPELRLLTNWQKIANLKIRNLETIAVPMIESVGQSEVANHNRLHSTWCATRQCENVLRARDVKNTAYIGHGFGLRLTREAIDKKRATALSRKTVVFCHIGGHNPHFRKQTAKIVEAFALAAEERDDIALQVYMMRNFSGVSRAQHPRISYHLGSLSHGDIVDVYRASDVSIQVASHEGLGLGFYESLATGTPILSLDLAPHNEVVRPGVSGWLIPVQPAPRAHPQGMVPGGYFNGRDPADAILRIRKDEVAEMIETAAQFHRGMFDEYALAERMVAALWRDPESE